MKYIKQGYIMKKITAVIFSIKKFIRILGLLRNHYISDIQKMILEIFLALLLGIIAGAFTGLAPGITRCKI